MDRFVSLLSENVDARLGGGDSFTDQLSARYTVMLLSTLVLLVTAKYYINEPISCWCPAHFESSHVDFTNKVCWTSNTYYLPLHVEELPSENDPREHVSYYQWVAFILTCQAILFYLPRVLWTTLSKKSGIAVCTITDAAIQCQKSSDADTRDKTLRYMTKHMGRHLLEHYRRYRLASHFKKCFLVLYGNYLVGLYLAVKLVYIANVVGQMFLLNAFLQTDYHLYGWQVMRKMMNQENWTTSDRFPRVTLCDFKIRLLGNIHRYTVQCALPMNLFNEIIFIFIWFWFAFVALVTAVSLVVWFVKVAFLGSSVEYVRTRLVAMSALHHRSTNAKVDKFVREYLRRDGCLIVQLVSTNASDLIAAEFVCGLWQHFKDNEKSIDHIFDKSASQLSLNQLNID